MGIRLPGNPSRNVTDFKVKQSDSVKAIARVVCKSPQRVISVWEKVATTYLDVNGAVFLDRDGIPFQGRKE